MRVAVALRVGVTTAVAVSMMVGGGTVVGVATAVSIGNGVGSVVGVADAVALGAGLSVAVAVAVSSSASALAVAVASANATATAVGVVVICAVGVSLAGVTLRGQNMITRASRAATPTTPTVNGRPAAGLTPVWGASCMRSSNSRTTASALGRLWGAGSIIFAIRSVSRFAVSSRRLVGVAESSLINVGVIAAKPGALLCWLSRGCLPVSI